jgi:hypothetical protein
MGDAAILATADDNGTLLQYAGSPPVFAGQTSSWTSGTLLNMSRVGSAPTVGDLKLPDDLCWISGGEHTRGKITFDNRSGRHYGVVSNLATRQNCDTAA